MDIFNPDILEFIILIIALLYFNLKIKPCVNPLNARLINIGLALLLFSALLDYLDGIEALSNVSLFNRDDVIHDILEDQVGGSCGIMLFVVGVFRELSGKRGK